MTSSAANTVNEDDSKAVRDAMRPFDGTLKRLEVYGDIPGHKLQWANDVGNRIPALLRFGWTFVTNGEVDVNDRVLDGNNALDDKVRRAVGGRADHPTFAYLVKIPDERHAVMMKALQAGPDAFDAAIRRGFGEAQSNMGSEKKQYTPPWAGQNIDDSQLTQAPAGIAGPSNPANPGGQQRVRSHQMGLGATDKR